MTLSVHNLFFYYERRLIVLNNLCFSVKKGEFIGIFGPNGGGKTTLLNLLVGFLEPVKGEIAVMGQRPSRVSHQIGYVPQMRRFDRQFPLSVMEVVLQGRLYKHRGFLSFSRKDKKAALCTLERVGLADRANAPFGLLSGGQIQRTLIARALVSEPKILVLDEAMTGVDPCGFQAIFDLLLTIKGEITILLVTHDLSTVASQMDHLFCINRSLTRYSPREVCGHFAMGLYHPPLLDRDDRDV